MSVLILILAAVFCGISIYAVIYPPLAAQKLFVRQNDTMLYEEPSISAPSVAKLPKNAEILRYAEHNVEGVMWSHVYYGKLSGYLMSRCLLEALAPEERTSQLYDHPKTQSEAFGFANLSAGMNTPSMRIVNVQLCLVRSGYLQGGEYLDGEFGEELTRAISEFQSAHQLPPTGEVDTATKNVLWETHETLLRRVGLW